MNYTLLLLVLCCTVRGFHIPSFDSANSDPARSSIHTDYNADGTTGHHSVGISDGPQRAVDSFFGMIGRGIDRANKAVERTHEKINKVHSLIHQTRENIHRNIHEIGKVIRDRTSGNNHIIVPHGSVDVAVSQHTDKPVIFPKEQFSGGPQFKVDDPKIPQATVGGQTIPESELEIILNKIVNGEIDNEYDSQKQTVRGIPLKNLLPVLKEYVRKQPKFSQQFETNENSEYNPSWNPVGVTSLEGLGTPTTSSRNSHDYQRLHDQSTVVTESTSILPEVQRSQYTYLPPIGEDYTSTTSSPLPIESSPNKQEQKINGVPVSKIKAYMDARNINGYILPFFSGGPDPTSATGEFTSINGVPISMIESYLIEHNIDAEHPPVTAGTEASTALPESEERFNVEMSTPLLPELKIQEKPTDTPVLKEFLVNGIPSSKIETYLKDRKINGSVFSSVTRNEFKDIPIPENVQLINGIPVPKLEAFLKKHNIGGSGNNPSIPRVNVDLPEQAVVIKDGLTTSRGRYPSSFSVDARGSAAGISETFSTPQVEQTVNGIPISKIEAHFKRNNIDASLFSLVAGDLNTADSTPILPGQIRAINGIPVPKIEAYMKKNNINKETFSSSGGKADAAGINGGVFPEVPKNFVNSVLGVIKLGADKVNKVVNRTNENINKVATIMHNTHENVHNDFHQFARAIKNHSAGFHIADQAPDFSRQSAPLPQNAEVQSEFHNTVSAEKKIDVVQNQPALALSSFIKNLDLKTPHIDHVQSFPQKELEVDSGINDKSLQSITLPEEQDASKPYQKPSTSISRGYKPTIQNTITINVPSSESSLSNENVQKIVLELQKKIQQQNTALTNDNLQKIVSELQKKIQSSDHQQISGGKQIVRTNVNNVENVDAPQEIRGDQGKQPAGTDQDVEYQKYGEYIKQTHYIPLGNSNAEANISNPEFVQLVTKKGMVIEPEASTTVANTEAETATIDIEEEKYGSPIMTKIYGTLCGTMLLCSNPSKVTTPQIEIASTENDTTEGLQIIDEPSKLSLNNQEVTDQEPEPSFQRPVREDSNQASKTKIDSIFSSLDNIINNARLNNNKQIEVSVTSPGPNEVVMPKIHKGLEKIGDKLESLSKHMVNFGSKVDNLSNKAMHDLKSNVMTSLDKINFRPQHHVSVEMPQTNVNVEVKQPEYEHSVVTHSENSPSQHQVQEALGNAVSSIKSAFSKATEVQIGAPSPRDLNLVEVQQYGVKMPNILHNQQAIDHKESSYVSPLEHNSVADSSIGIQHGNMNLPPVSSYYISQKSVKTINVGHPEAKSLFSIPEQQPLKTQADIEHLSRYTVPTTPPHSKGIKVGADVIHKSQYGNIQLVEIAPGVRVVIPQEIVKVDQHGSSHKVASSFPHKTEIVIGPPVEQPKPITVYQTAKIDHTYPTSQQQTEIKFGSLPETASDADKQQLQLISSTQQVVGDIGQKFSEVQKVIRPPVSHQKPISVQSEIEFSSQQQTDVKSGSQQTFEDIGSLTPTASESGSQYQMQTVIGPPVSQQKPVGVQKEIEFSSIPQSRQQKTDYSSSSQQISHDLGIESIPQKQTVVSGQQQTDIEFGHAEPSSSSQQQTEIQFGSIPQSGQHQTDFAPSSQQVSQDLGVDIQKPNRPEKLTASKLPSSQKQTEIEFGSVSAYPKSSQEPFHLGGQQQTDIQFGSISGQQLTDFVPSSQQVSQDISVFNIPPKLTSSGLPSSQQQTDIQFGHIPQVSESAQQQTDIQFGHIPQVSESVQQQTDIQFGRIPQVSKSAQQQTDFAPSSQQISQDFGVAKINIPQNIKSLESPTSQQQTDIVFGQPFSSEIKIPQPSSVSKNQDTINSDSSIKKISLPGGIRSPYSTELLEKISSKQVQTNVDNSPTLVNLGSLGEIPVSNTTLNLALDTNDTVKDSKYKKAESKVDDLASKLMGNIDTTVAEHSPKMFPLDKISVHTKETSENPWVHTKDVKSGVLTKVSDVTGNDLIEEKYKSSEVQQTTEPLPFWKKVVNAAKDVKNEREEALKELGHTTEEKKVTEKIIKQVEESSVTSVSDSIASTTEKLPFWKRLINDAKKVKQEKEQALKTVKSVDDII